MMNNYLHTTLCNVIILCLFKNLIIDSNKSEIDI